jgi:hypothetical protein
MLIADPNLEKLRTERLEAAVRAPITEQFMTEPTLKRPWTETPEPARMHARRDSVLPRLRKLNTETADPNLPYERILMLLETRTQPRIDGEASIAHPRIPAELTDKPLPIRAKERTLIELPT